MVLRCFLILTLSFSAIAAPPPGYGTYGGRAFRTTKAIAYTRTNSEGVTSQGGLLHVDTFDTTVWGGPIGTGLATGFVGAAQEWLLFGLGAAATCGLALVNLYQAHQISPRIPIFLLPANQRVPRFPGEVLALDPEPSRLLKSLVASGKLHHEKRDSETTYVTRLTGVDLLEEDRFVNQFGETVSTVIDIRLEANWTGNRPHEWKSLAQILGWKTLRPTGAIDMDPRFKRK